MATAASSLVLPARPPSEDDARLTAFEEPEGAVGLKTETIDPDPGGRTCGAIT